MLSNIKMKMEVTEDGSDVTSPQHWNNEILKRERVESLVSMIKKEPPSLKLTPGEHFYTQPINGCKKRKFYHPQQQPQPQRRPPPEMEEETEEEEEEEAEPHHHHQQQQQQSLSEDWRHKVTEMQLQLATMQRRLIQMYSKGQSTSPEIEKTTPSPATGIENLIENAASSYGISSEDWSCLAQSLKTGMSKLIDEWAKRYGQRSKPTNHHHLLPQTTPTSVRVLQPVFPQSPLRYAPYPPRSGTPPPPSHDDDSPMSLVVSPRKRRWKVTDKVIRMQQSRYSEDQSDVPTNLSLSNPSHQSAMKQQSELNSMMLMMSPDSSPFKTDTEGEFGLASATLTPLHLRKAKLMFFYVRYPTSSVLKENFPDIKFNKNNTAQLVKWFSNFREFYYIQMEKYARQALSDGCASSSEVTVSTDSDIYRVLTQHYNRNTNIKVPVNFRYVIEQTLREFFDAISLGKNNDPSWKKVIYKVIARLDDPLPPFFKSTHFVDQLD